ncbi:hypothetical protein A3Q56_00213 [Intoshia linei]|uniref:Uncharacterized protein n=1 Tax=Intoshia linei TaxID=1819745 RepID=A0A177BEA3_9BILA|nr:hypothetical protein A3Q56_00213 [Intoshia linei]
MNKSELDRIRQHAFKVWTSYYNNDANSPVEYNKYNYRHGKKSFNYSRNFHYQYQNECYNRPHAHLNTTTYVLPHVAGFEKSSRNKCDYRMDETVSPFELEKRLKIKEKFKPTIENEAIRPYINTIDLDVNYWLNTRRDCINRYYKQCENSIKTKMYTAIKKHKLSTKVYSERRPEYYIHPEWTK